MTKDLSKVIMSKSKAKNKYLNWLSRENFISYKRTKNKCNSLTKKAKRFLQRGHKRWNYHKQKIWCTVKHFLLDNDCTSKTS